MYVQSIGPILVEQAADERGVENEVQTLEAGLAPDPVQVVLEVRALELDLRAGQQPFEVTLYNLAPVPVTSGATDPSALSWVATWRIEEGSDAAGVKKDASITCGAISCDGHFIVVGTSEGGMVRVKRAPRPRGCCQAPGPLPQTRAGPSS